LTAGEDSWSAPATQAYSAGHLIKFFGDKLVGDLDEEDIDAFGLHRMEEDGVKASTVNRDLNCLRAALRRLKTRRVVRDIPEVSAFEEDAVAIPWLTQDQARRLIAAAQEPHLQLFIRLGLLTGARSGAILDLTCDRVDFDREDHGVIDYRDPLRKTTKKRRTAVRVPESLKAALQTAVGNSKSGYVVEYRGAPVQKIRTGFHAARTRAQLPDTYTPHTLRHTCTTWLMRAGVDIAEVSQLIGDRIETIQRRYWHHHPDALQQSVKVLDTFLR